MPTPYPYPHGVPVDLMEPHSGRAAGDRVPCHLFMPEVAWPAPVGPVLRADRGGGVPTAPEALAFADAAQGLQRSCAADYGATYVVRYTSCPSCGGSVAFRVEQGCGSGSKPVPPKPPAVRPGQRGGYLVEAAMILLGAFVLIAILLASFTRPDRPLDSTDAPTGQRSEMAVRVDALTGCQYLADVRGGLTPRLGPDGRQLCGAGVPR